MKLIIAVEAIGDHQNEIEQPHGIPNAGDARDERARDRQRHSRHDSFERSGADQSENEFGLC